MWSAITCLCFEITEKVGIGCIWWIIPWLSWGHCCADFIAILTQGKNDLALFVFSLDQATFKISQLFWFAHKQLETSWDDLSTVLFSTSSAVQWFLALDTSFFVPTDSSSFVHFAFVTFSALLFAFIYGFCLTLKKLYKQTCTEMGDIFKECLGTSRIDKFAKLKAQPAKKCLFFFLFTYCCGNKKQQTAFHCCALILKLTSHFTVGSRHPIWFQLYSFITYCGLREPLS